MSRRLLHSADGAPLQIGDLVGKGGEGEVRAVIGHPDLVAKLYTTPPPPERAAKINAMVAHQTPALTRIAAWPTATVHERPGGSLVGFLMPRLSGHRELHYLSHPMDRLKHHPEVGYDFIVHVAANIARAFETLHEAGLVVGDVNESCIMVHPDGTVMFIDTDSMQFSDGTTRYGCDVGKVEFQPPEVLRNHTSFRGLARTAEHDAFGLGVIIFQLLFFGWHPFAVRMLNDEQKTTADNIKADRFPYGLGFRSREYARPPHALDPAVFPDHVRDLIERAFMPGKTRPAPREWVAGLERLAGESVICNRYGTHFFHKDAGRCPFCELDARLGFAILPHIAFDAIKLREVWQLLQATWFELNAPTPTPDLPLPDPPAVPEELVANANLAKRLTRFQMVLVIAGIGLAFIAWPLVALATLAVPIELHLKRTRPAAWRELRASLKRSRDAFAAAEAQLASPNDAAVIQNHEDARQAFDRLLHHDDHRQALVRRLHDDKVASQLRRWLEQHRVGKAVIAAAPGATTALLEARGFRTAADIGCLRREPMPAGFTPALVQALTRWEYQLTNRFTPDLDDPALERATTELHRKLDVENAQLMQRLVLGSEWLLQRRPTERERRARAVEAWREARLNLARDEALWEVAGRRV